MASSETVKQKLGEIGVSSSDENINKILNQVKSLEKGSISDEDLNLISSGSRYEKNMFQSL